MARLWIYTFNSNWKLKIFEEREKFQQIGIALGNFSRKEVSLGFEVISGTAQAYYFCAENFRRQSHLDLLFTSRRQCLGFVRIYVYVQLGADFTNIGVQAFSRACIIMRAFSIKNNKIEPITKKNTTESFSRRARAYKISERKKQPRRQPHQRDIHRPVKDSPNRFSLH